MSRQKGIFSIGPVVLAVVGLSALGAQAGTAASPIPDSRSIDWSNSGVPGGIPQRTAIHATIDAAAYGTGTADASGAINTAIAGCPSNQVVYLPAGTYRLNTPITLGAKRRITLRGAGIGKTVLRPADSLHTAVTTGQAGLSSERRILGGSAKGSRAITVENAQGIQPGTILDIFQDDDPDFYWTRGLTRHTGQFVMVTAVNGAVIEFEDPLVWSFTLNPTFKYQTNAGMTWCGIEDLTIEAGSSYGGSMIQFWNAYASWIRNVETAWGNGNEHIALFGCLRCDVRDCYIHDTYSTTDGYGVLTMAGYGGPRGGCTGLRIENNIFSGLWCSIVLETEVGTVIAYNYSRNARFPGWPDYQIQEFNGNHGPHGMMCLFEGNIAGGLQQDGYHGSVSHITYFRNWFSGAHVETNRTGNIKTVDLCRFSYYHNVVGNVLGSPSWPRTTTGRYEMSGTPDYTAQTVIYRLGYPNMGNNYYHPTNPPGDPDNGGLDPKVKRTLMRWGNFDYQNNATRWQTNELPAGVPVPPDHTLPASLYRSAKPGWWGELPWPAIGPDRSPMVGRIPAELRYMDLTGAQVDGIPASWLIRQFGSTNAANGGAQDDADGDGVDNWGEYVAGTAATNPDSVLRLSGTVPAGTPDCILSWESVPGRTYDVEASTNTPAGPWHAVPGASHLPAAGGTMGWTNPLPPANACFYRLCVEIAE